MYKSYMQERLGVEIIESDVGFITYRKLNDNQIYIVDVYVVPEFRRSGNAKELSSKVYDLAKEHGVKQLIGSVDLTANGVTTSLQALLGDGFKFSHAQGNGLYFVKDVEDGVCI